jgi:hypothetical protein
LESEAVNSDVTQQIVADRRHTSEVDSQPYGCSKRNERLKLRSPRLARGHEYIV